MLHLLGVCSIILGVLGVVMSCYSLYVIVLNERLETKMVQKDILIAEQSETIESSKKNIIEIEGHLRILREDIGAKNRTINHLRRAQKAN